MAIIQTVFSTLNTSEGTCEFWLKYNDNTMKITRGGVDNNCGDTVKIRLEDTQLQQAFETTLESGESIDQNVGGFNWDAIDVGEDGEEIIQPPDHVLLFASTV